MRLSLLAATLIVLAPSVAAVPEPAAPATTTQPATTSGAKQAKPYNSPKPKSYTPKNNTPVKVTVYKTVTSTPKGYTVTKTVTAAGTCSSSSSTTTKPKTSTTTSIKKSTTTSISTTSAPTNPSTPTTTAPPCNPTSFLFRIVAGGGLEGHYFGLDSTLADNTFGLGTRVVATPNATLAEPWTISPLNALVSDHTGTHTWATKPQQSFFFIAPITDATYASQMPLGSAKDLGVRYLPCFVGPTDDGRVNAVPGAVGALTCVRPNGVVPRLVSCPGAIRLLVGQQDDSPSALECDTLVVAAIARVVQC